MPGLTVTEKSHWKDRIAARIDKRVEAIKARHPTLFDRVRREARTRALESLGLAGPHAELEAAEALARRQAAHQEQLLADDPVGQQIARLDVEKDGLLDTVWLATSSAQIKQLWAKVGELLGDEPTRLEREALAIPPIDGVAPQE